MIPYLVLEMHPSLGVQQSCIIQWYFEHAVSEGILSMS